MKAKQLGESTYILSAIVMEFGEWIGGSITAKSKQTRQPVLVPE